MNRWEQQNVEAFRDYRRDELVRATRQAQLVGTPDGDEAPRSSFKTVFAAFNTRVARFLRRRPARLAQKAA